MCVIFLIVWYFVMTDSLPHNQIWGQEATSKFLPLEYLITWQKLCLSVILILLDEVASFGVRNKTKANKKQKHAPPLCPFFGSSVYQALPRWQQPEPQHWASQLVLRILWVMSMYYAVYEVDQLSFKSTICVKVMLTVQIFLIVVRLEKVWTPRCRLCGPPRFLGSGDNLKYRFS